MLGRLGGTLGAGLIFGLGFGLIIGLVIGLTDRRVTHIEVVSAIRWSWSPTRFELILGLTFGLGFGLVGALLGLVVGLGSALVGGLIVGLVGGLVFLLIGGLAFALDFDEVKAKTTPNQGITWSFRGVLVVGLVGGLGFGLGFGLVVGFALALFSGWGFGLVVGLVIALYSGLAGALVVGLSSGLNYGGRTVLQHLVLRWLFYHENALPLRLIPFLDYCTGRIFLRKIGGGYIFVHRLLMEYFGELNTATHFHKTTNRYRIPPWEFFIGLSLLAVVAFSGLVFIPHSYRVIIAEYYYRQGVAARDLGQATSRYRKAIELSPSDPRYWNSLCWDSSLSGRAVEALPICEHARVTLEKLRSE